MPVRRTRLTLTTLAVVVTALGLGAGPLHADTAAPAKAQVCGIPPGEGAYSYIKVWNITCDRAHTVANKVAEQFCEESGQCSPAEGELNRGKENFRGWSCRLTVAYEFFRVRCERPGKRFVRESAA